MFMFLLFLLPFLFLLVQLPVIEFTIAFLLSASQTFLTPYSPLILGDYSAGRGPQPCTHSRGTRFWTSVPIPTHTMEGISAVSLNVNGLNVPSKRRILFDHIRRSKADVALIQETHATGETEGLWRREWGGPAYFNNGSQSSKGVAILVSRDLCYDFVSQKSDEDGRILCVDLKIKDTIFTVCSVYAPTQDKPGEQLETLCNLEEMLEDQSSINIIAGGDFNCFMDPFLDRNSRAVPPSHTDSYRTGLSALLDRWSLCDVWRLRNPGKSGFTFRRGKYASRLDYIFISSHLSELATSSAPKTLVHSDHALISISITSSKCKRGPGLWRFDNTLLESQKFVSEMTDFLREWAPPPELSDPNVVWEWLKYQIKGFVCTFTRNIYSLEKQHLTDLNRELEHLYARADESCEDLSMEIDSIKRELREIEEEKARKIIFRAKCNWALYAERPTKYFLNLEKRRSRECTMNSVFDEEGREVTDIADILRVGRTFYENLYKSQEDTLTPMADIQREWSELNLPRIPSDRKELLDAPFSQEELKTALSHLNKNKSPGSDGITPEFMTCFWDLVNRYFCESLDFSIAEGRLSSGQRRGIITLIPKKDVDRRLIANWRPIALLNTDYKIFTKALALRLQRVMGLLIHPNQTGFMSGRIIGDSVRLVEDALDFIRESVDEGMVVALDFSKAFDSVRWDLIFAALEKFNFGDAFIGYIRVLFTDVETCLINAGTTSDTFYPGRGIRQGCCVSPFIFILVAEVLAAQIRQNERIRGIQLGPTEIKLTQFADDTTCVLADETSLRELISTLDLFESWSGLRINKAKTKVISPKLVREGSTCLQNMTVVSSAKILGIWLSLDNSEETTYQKNYKPILDKIRNVCESWSLRGLSLKGKVTVANALLVSLLQYPSAIIHTPQRVFREYKQIVTGFLWNNRKAKISYESIIQPVEGGGLKLIDLDTRVQVNLLQWIKRLLNHPDMNIGPTLRHILKTDDLSIFLSFRKPPLPPDIGKYKFYARMLDVFNKYHDFEPVNEEAIRGEKLWHNPQVGGRGQGSSIYWPRWDKAGISTVGQICHASENRLLSHFEIAAKFKINCSFLDALSMRLNIPLYWREALSANWKSPPVTGSGVSLYIQEEEQPKDIGSLSAKGMYGRIVTLRRKSNAAYTRWLEGEDGLRIPDAQEWSNICRRAFSSSRETKLQSFQYRILNRILPCRVFLKRIKISDTDTCRFCQEQDTVAHFLVKCSLVRDFWRGVCKWFGESVNLYLDRLSDGEIVFGLPHSCHKSRVINFILVHVRFYIYRQKLYHDGRLSLVQWLTEFRYKLKIEEWISRRIGKPASFHCWRNILNELG